MDFIRPFGESINMTGAAALQDPGTARRGEDLGLDFSAFYVLGRGGVLGDVDADVVSSSMFFLNPVSIERIWDAGRERVAPREVADVYAAAVQAFGRERLSGVDGLDEFCTAVERVITAADARGLALFAGWRALPVPDGAAPRAMHLIHLLREYRGGCHGLAARATGLSPVEAIMVKDGEGIARLFGWRDDLPDPEPLRDRHEGAERLTDELVSPHFESLSPAELELISRVADDCRRAAGAGDAAAVREKVGQP